LARNVEGGLSRLPGQIGLAWRIFRHCIFRSGFANGYRNGIPLQVDWCARNVGKQETLACHWYAKYRSTLMLF
jgi:hypothetical protein